MGAIASLEREIATAERRAAALRKVVEAAQDLGEEGIAEVFCLFAGNGNGSKNGAKTSHAPEETETSPRGRAAIRVIVGERPGIWTLADLRAELQRRGWFTSGKAVETACSRLCAKREGRRIGKGRYVFPANHGEFLQSDREEGAIESEPSAEAMIPAA